MLFRSNRKEQLREVLVSANVYNRPAGDAAADLRLDRKSVV